MCFPYTRIQEQSCVVKWGFHHVVTLLTKDASTVLCSMVEWVFYPAATLLTKGAECCL